MRNEVILDNVVLQGQSSWIRSRLLVPEDNVKVEC